MSARTKALTGRLLLFLCVLSLSGTHVAVMQLFAWGSMVVEDARNDIPVYDSVGEVLSGEKPCFRCRAIATLSRQDQSDEPQRVPATPLDVRLLLSLLEQGDRWVDPPGICLMTLDASVLTPRSEADQPLSPPPQSAS